MRDRFFLSTIAADLVALTGAAALSSWLVFGTLFPWTAQPDIWLLLSFMVIGALAASFVSIRTWGSAVPRPSYGRAIGIVSLAFGLTTMAVLLTRSYYSIRFLGYSMGLWLLGAIAHRAVRRRRPWKEDMVVVTAEKGLVDDLRSAPHAEVLRHIDPGTEGAVDPMEPGASLAVDFRAVLSDRMAQYVSSCALAGLPVRPMSMVYEEHTGRLPIVHLAEGWELSTPVLKVSPYIGGKRLFDVVVVLVTAPLNLVLGAIVALLVKASSPGPAIFKQERIGRNGQPFTLYKFRTMAVDAEEEGPRLTQATDERLTSVGRWLRKIRIDELPQLWNVLKGDLSLVGPRPEQVAFVELFNETIPFYSHRHLIRPGVTGWAQVHYGYADDEADTVEKLTYDLYYVKHMSPWVDLHVLGRSVWTILSGFGAQ